MAAAGIVALVMLFAVELGPRDDEKLAMAADWPTMLFALLDGVIAVALTLWFVAWVQRRWPSHGALLERAGRASYATYFIHPLVLTAVMILFASVLLAPVIKFVLVAAVAIPACFVGRVCAHPAAGLLQGAVTCRAVSWPSDSVTGPATGARRRADWYGPPSARASWGPRRGAPHSASSPLGGYCSSGWSGRVAVAHPGTRR
jgi:hypothetical protein